MTNPLGIGLIAVGIVLLVLGVSSAESLSSELSEFFTGSPSEKSVWLLLGGVAAVVTGIAMTVRSRRA